MAFENCTFLGYYAASSGNFVPAFRDNISVPSSGVNENCDLLGYYAAYSGNSLPTFRYKFSVSFLRVKILTLEGETGKLSRNFGKKLPLLAA